MAKSSSNVGYAQGRYNGLKIDRDPFLRRARRCGSLTIPSLFRQEGDNGATDQPLAWQSFGAYGVNNVSAKTVLALFPPGTPFFKYTQSDATLQSYAQLSPSDAAELSDQVDLGLAIAETKIVECIEEDGDRVAYTEIARALYVGGNHAFHMRPDGKLRTVPLDHYVTVRSPSGETIEWVIEDPIAFDALEPDIRAFVEANGYKRPANNSMSPICVYTHGTLADGSYTIYQEVYGLEVDGSRWTVPAVDCPYVFIPFNLLRGEHYGRGYCEDYEGDLQNLDGLYQIITEAGAAAALFVRMVNPAGVTSKKALTEAGNGAIITGRGEDVSTVQSEKTQDLAFAEQRLDKIEGRMSKAFLLNSAVQRGGERVTAEEIRYVAKELEDQLGGVYSNLVTAWQLPYARLKIAALTKAGRVTRLPKKSVKLKILTGAAALGRLVKVQDWKAFLSDVSSVLASPAIQYFHAPILISKFAAGYAVDIQGAALSADELAQQQQASQMSSLAQGTAPEIVRQVGQASQQTQKLAAEAQQQPEPAQ